MRCALHPHESAQTLLSPQPGPWPEQPCGRLAAAAQPPVPSPGHSQGWQPRGHAARLCASPPRFIPSRYTVAAFYLDHFSALWYFSCFSNPPPPQAVAGFLRRLVFGESCEHICSLATAFQEGPVRGAGLGEPGHARPAEAGAQGPAPRPPNAAVEARSGHEHCGRQG